MAETASNRRQAAMDPIRRRLQRRDAALIVLAIAAGVSAGWIAPRSVKPAEHQLWRIHDRAEHVVYIGGILLERNRHVVAGSAIGCTLGAAIGVGSAAVVGILTGGAGFAAIPPAAVAGCALIGLGGATIGRPLDDYIDFYR